MEDNELFLNCECGACIMRIVKQVEFLNGPEEEIPYTTFELAMFKYGQESTKHSFKERIKNAWKYIKTGKMFSDQMVLTVAEASKLNKFLAAELTEKK